MRRAPRDDEDPGPAAHPPAPVDPVDLALRRAPSPWTWFAALLAGAAAAGTTAWRSELWPLVWAVWLATWVLAARAVRRLSVDGLALAERHDRLARRIGVVEWEGPGPAGPPDGVGAAVEPVLGFVPAECADGAMPAGQVEPEDLGVFAASRQRVADGHDTVVTYRLRDGRGRVRHVEEHVDVVRDDDGRVLRRFGVVVDTTRRAVLEARTRRLAEFAELIDLPAAVLRLEDLDRPGSFEVRLANAAAGDQLHLWAGDRPVAEDAERTGPLADVPGIGRRLAEVVRLHTPFAVPVHGAGGDLLELRVVPLGDQSVGITAGPPAPDRADHDASRLALHDPLTGLPNRTLLLDRTRSALARARRIDEPLAVLVVHLDGFDDLVRSLGGGRSDQVVAELAERYTERLRDCDTVGRLDTGEFAVVLSTGATVDGTRDVADRIARLTGEPVDVGDTPVVLSATVGAARHPDHGVDATELLRRARRAADRARRDGAPFAFFSDDADHVDLRHAELRAGLTAAGWSDEPGLTYRPRIDVRTLEPVGVSATAVWEHPAHGAVGLADLAAAGVPAGDLVRLARAAVERAVGEVGPLGLLDGAVRLTVDLTGLGPLEPTFADGIRTLVDAHHLPAGALGLALTHAQADDPAGGPAEVLARLRTDGVRVAVTGAGSTDAPAAVVADLAVDEVVVHRRFVRELAEGDPAGVRRLVEVAHGAGLRVTADGVDSPEVLDRLRDLGCDSALGAMAGGHMDVDELDAYLHQRTRV